VKTEKEKRVDDESSEHGKSGRERKRETKLQDLVYLSLDRNSLGLLELDVGFLLLARGSRGNIPSPLLDSSSAGQDGRSSEVSVDVDGGSSSLPDAPNDERLSSSSLKIEKKERGN